MVDETHIKKALALKPPPPVPVKTPPCEARVWHTWPNAEWKDCAHSSAYAVDGKNFCTKHAQVRALEILLEQ